MNIDRAIHWHATKEWHGYFMAFFATGLAVAIRYFFFRDTLAERMPFLFVNLSAIISAWYGGFRPGLLATILGASLAVCCTVPLPLLAHDIGIQLGFAFFVLSGILFSFLFETLHVERGRLLHKRRLLEEEVSRRHEAQQRLVEADQKKNHFLAAVAHELRSPLGAISNAAQFLKQPHDEKAGKSALRIIERQARQMTSLIDDLTESTRITEDKLKLEMRPLSVCDVLRYSIDAAWPLIEAKGHSLSTDFPSEPIWVKGDQTRLTQIFSNILANAAKYTDTRGSIRMAARVVGAEVRVTVSDTGIGIEPEMLRRVFDLYTQADHALTQSQGGLGIGLNLVKRLTDLHGGRVEARSAGIGKGSTFEVALPTADPPSQQLTEQKPTSPEEKSRHCILVVDDNQESAETLAMMLEAFDNDVKVAYDGRTAIRAAQTFKPDLILLDLSLPEIDGYEVCRILRGIPTLKNAKIIAQTGWGAPEQRQSSKEAGFDDHLVKPIDVQMLRALLNSYKGKDCPGEKHMKDDKPGANC